MVSNTERSTMTLRIDAAVRRVRPAPLQAFILKLLRLSQRREIDVGGYRFYSDPTSNFGVELMAGGYEPNMVQVLNRYLHPGATFLDLGTNEGFFSVVASKIVGNWGQVVSVEPQTRLLPIIHKNLSLNTCYNCRVIQCALNDASGEVVIHLAPTTNSGATSIFRATKYPLHKESVRCWRLAEFVDLCGLNSIDLIKVDIEGAEYDVFMPAGEILRSGRIRNIALEYHEQSMRRRGLEPDDLHRHLMSCGYRMIDVLGPRVYELATK